MQGEALWLVVNTRPEVPILVSEVAGTFGFKKLSLANKLVRGIKNKASANLRFKPIRNRTLRDLAMLGQLDVDVQTMPQSRSQVGELYFIVQANETPATVEKALRNMVHWRCGRVRRICRASMTGEMLVATDGLDTLEYLVAHFREWVLGERKERQKVQDFSTLYFSTSPHATHRLMPAYLTTDWRDLIDHMSHLSLTLTEKRLCGDFRDLAEALQRKSLEAIFWLRREEVIADGLTSQRTSQKLITFQSDSFIRYVPAQGTIFKQKKSKKVVESVNTEKAQKGAVIAHHDVAEHEVHGDDNDGGYSSHGGRAGIHQQGARAGETAAVQESSGARGRPGGGALRDAG